MKRWKASNLAPQTGEGHTGFFRTTISILICFSHIPSSPTKVTINYEGKTHQIDVPADGTSILEAALEAVSRPNFFSEMAVHFRVSL